MYNNKTYTHIKPIVFSHTYIGYYKVWPYNKYSVNVYREDTSDPDYGIYSFYTNEKSQRKITFTSAYACDYYETYIHVDDINK